MFHQIVVVRLIFVEARDVCIPQDSIGTMIAMMAAVFLLSIDAENVGARLRGAFATLYSKYQSPTDGWMAWRSWREVRGWED